MGEDKTHGMWARALTREEGGGGKLIKRRKIKIFISVKWESLGLGFLGGERNSLRGARE